MVTILHILTVTVCSSCDEQQLRNLTYSLRTTDIELSAAMIVDL